MKLGSRHSEESLKKMSVSLTGRKFSDEIKSRMKIAAKRRWYNEDYRNAVVGAIKERYNSPEFIKKFSERMKMVKISEEKLVELREKILEEKNPRWKGDDVGYSGVHDFVRSRKPKSSACERCGRTNIELELAYSDHFALREGRKYIRDVTKFNWLCCRCHQELDGRLNALHEARKKVSGVIE